MPTRCNLGPLPAPAWHRPWLRYIDPVDGAEVGNGDTEPKFPANTPVKDMTPEQQAAYHLHQARKHEGRVKAFGDWTPEKITALVQERDQLKTQGQSAADKALDDAREEGRTEVRAVLNRERAVAALEKALSGRTPDAGALLGLDVTQFVVNGKVDTDAVKAWVDDHSAAPTQAQRKGIDLGAGRRAEVKETAGDRGRSEAARRFKKTDS